MPENHGAEPLVTHGLQMTAAKKHSQTIIVSVLFVSLLAIGIITSMLAISRSQDVRRNASTDFGTDTAIQPGDDPYPPTLKCDWCGSQCQPVVPNQGCPEISAPIGYSCGVSSDGTTCVTQKIECTPKPPCMFDNPACMIKLPANTVFCADSDLNHDSVVNQQDFDLLSMHFFDTSPADLLYDITHDHKIDIFDYSVMVKEWTR